MTARPSPCSIRPFRSAVANCSTVCLHDSTPIPIPLLYPPLPASGGELVRRFVCMTARPYPSPCSIRPFRPTDRLPAQPARRSAGGKYGGIPRKGICRHPRYRTTSCWQPHPDLSRTPLACPFSTTGGTKSAGRRWNEKTGSPGPGRDAAGQEFQ